jgi:hypothetical protein
MILSITIRHFTLCIATQNVVMRRHDTPHNDIHQNDTQHNIKEIATLSIMTPNTLFWMSFMLSVANKPIMLNVYMKSVSTLNVVAPLCECSANGCLIFIAVLCVVMPSVVLLSVVAPLPVRCRNGERLNFFSFPHFLKIGFLTPSKGWGNLT